MANKGWNGQLGGSGQPANARTTGRTSGTDGAEAFIRPAPCGFGGYDNDTLDQRSDLFEPPGQARKTSNGN